MRFGRCHSTPHRRVRPPLIVCGNVNFATVTPDSGQLQRAGTPIGNAGCTSRKSAFSQLWHQLGGWWSSDSEPPAIQTAPSDPNSWGLYPRKARISTPATPTHSLHAWRADRVSPSTTSGFGWLVVERQRAPSDSNSWGLNTRKARVSTPATQRLSHPGRT